METTKFYFEFIYGNYFNQSYKDLIKNISNAYHLFNYSELSTNADYFQAKEELIISDEYKELNNKIDFPYIKLISLCSVLTFDITNINFPVNQLNKVTETLYFVISNDSIFKKTRFVKNGLFLDHNDKMLLKTLFIQNVRLINAFENSTILN